MVAHQAPPSLGFSRQEHWSGLPFPSPMHESEKGKWSHSVVSNSLRPHGLQPTLSDPIGCSLPWDFQGKSTGVGCHFLLQGIFPTQGLNPGLPYCGQTLYPLSHQGSPTGHYSAIKENEWDAINSNMDRPKDCHTEWSQTETKIMR